MGGFLPPPPGCRLTAVPGPPSLWVGWGEGTVGERGGCLRSQRLPSGRSPQGRRRAGSHLPALTRPPPCCHPSAAARPRLLPPASCRGGWAWHGRAEGSSAQGPGGCYLGPPGAAALRGTPCQSPKQQNPPRSDPAPTAHLVHSSQHATRPTTADTPLPAACWSRPEAPACSLAASREVPDALRPS